MKSALSTALVFGLALSCVAQEQPHEQPKSKPIELEVLKTSVGVWDAEIEVWPQGQDSPSIKFKGVETNRPYGEYWIASDFDSEYEGQATKVHSIVGYDLDRKQLIGTVIDHGPYSASMTGDYDKKSKAVTWVTKARDTNGKPMVQKALVTHINDNERVLECLVPGEKKDAFITFMKIKFVKRK